MHVVDVRRHPNWRTQHSVSHVCWNPNPSRTIFLLSLVHKTWTLLPQVLARYSEGNLTSIFITTYFVHQLVCIRCYLFGNKNVQRVWWPKTAWDQPGGGKMCSWPPYKFHSLSSFAPWTRNYCMMPALAAVPLVIERYIIWSQCFAPSFLKEKLNLYSGLYGNFILLYVK